MAVIRRYRPRHLARKTISDSVPSAPDDEQNEVLMAPEEIAQSVPARTEVRAA